MKLLIESGATKSDWRLLEGGDQVKSFLRPGMNVSSGDMCAIKDIFSDVFSSEGIDSLDECILYTAGVVTEEIRTELSSHIGSLASIDRITIENDLLGAARALFGDKPGIALILGTGSNTCFFDGKAISRKVYSGGFIIGDEGSASVLGKSFISDFIKKRVPEDIAREFSSRFDSSYESIVEGVYHSASPAGYLGSFAPFIIQHYAHPYIKLLVDSNFQAFIDKAVKQYDTSAFPVGVIGGFGFACKDIFRSLCEKSGLHVSAFLPEPIEGLIEYHL